MKESINIIILAAGKGSRIESKTPKILLKLKSKTLIEHSISFAKRLNPRNIYIILNPKFCYLEKKIRDCKFI